MELKTSGLDELFNSAKHDVSRKMIFSKHFWCKILAIKTGSKTLTGCVVPYADDFRILEKTGNVDSNKPAVEMQASDECIMHMQGL